MKMFLIFLLPILGFFFCNDTKGDYADVIAVSVSGQSGDYHFSVKVKSPDTGCDKYCDWWEVLSEDGELLYRRILLHSHTDEQPFECSGGPVSADAQDTLIVRAHMNTKGYGGKAMRGTVADGFKEAKDIKADFAKDVENDKPQPSGCAF